MNFKPTIEQEKIFHFVKNRDENLLIVAYAGCGKTTTLVEIANMLPKDKQITSLAFNKHIQEELKTKLPEYIRCYTTYGLGMAAIKRKYGGKITFDEFKVDKIISKKSKSWSLENEFKSHEDIYTYLYDLKKLVNYARASLSLTSESIPYLIEKYDVNLNKTEDIKRTLKILDVMANDRTTYDFTDMIFLPAIDNSIWFFPQDYVMVDEIQDMNRCQIKIIEKIIRKDKVTGKPIGRLFAVGDKFQNIYNFNCSDSQSFTWFEKYPNIKILPLSYSFRCAKNVIINANTLVKEIKALDTAPDGIVRHNGNVLNEAESGDFVLCRTTMPLVKLFFGFLMEHKKAVVKGSDIGINLTEMIGKILDIEKLKSHWSSEVFKFKNDLYGKGILNPNEHSGYIALEDKVTVLLFLASMSNTVLELKDKIKYIFNDDINGKGIILSTVHKAKGLEANRVFIIRPDLLPMKTARKPWQVTEERNIQYVALTRSRLELIYDHEFDKPEDEK
jgi:DNA helicase-2/ATP-dependent DNA helicase PcrA